MLTWQHAPRIYAHRAYNIINKTKLGKKKKRRRKKDCHRTMATHCLLYSINYFCCASRAFLIAFQCGRVRDFGANNSKTLLNYKQIMQITCATRRGYFSHLFFPEHALVSMLHFVEMVFSGLTAVNWQTILKWLIEKVLVSTLKECCNRFQ